MKRSSPLYLFSLLLISNSVFAIDQTTVDIDRFGKVTVFQGGVSPIHVVIFASGAGGWNAEAAAIASSLAGENTVVAGFDLRIYIENVKAEDIICPAADFENFGRQLERKMGLKQFHFPVLAGMAEGGTLVYIAEAEAPTNFLGGVSLGFCPNFPLFLRKVCSGWGLKSERSKSGTGFIFCRRKI